MHLATSEASSLVRGTPAPEARLIKVSAALMKTRTFGTNHVLPPLIGRDTVRR